jgi:hypothetical protein
VDDRVERYDAGPGRVLGWKPLQGSLVNAEFWRPLASHREHFRRQVDAADVLVPLGEIPGYVARAAPNVCDWARTREFKERHEKSAVQRLAVELSGKLRAVLPRDRVVTAFASAGTDSGADGSGRSLC